MPTESLLYKRSLKINDDIAVVIPTVGDVIKNEDAYYGLVSAFTSMPIDMMVQLDDIGIDFESIDEYELFLILFESMKKEDLSLILGDLDLSQFKLAVGKKNGDFILLNPQNNICIDRFIHRQIANSLRRIHGLEKNTKKPGNAEAKKYMIERARAKQRRNINKLKKSDLETLIIALVNTEQFKYNYEQTLNLSIYQFNASVRQIIKKVEYMNLMRGVYTGNINVSDLKQEDLTWFNFNN